MDYPRYVFGPLGKMKLVKNNVEHDALLKADYYDDPTVMQKSFVDFVDDSTVDKEALKEAVDTLKEIQAVAVTAADDLATKSRAELAALVKGKGLKIPHNASKAQLVDILRGV